MVITNMTQNEQAFTPQNLGKIYSQQPGYIQPLCQVCWKYVRKCKGATGKNVDDGFKKAYYSET